MRVNADAMTLYAVTDRTWVEDTTLINQVKEALEGGITFLQLREKHLSKEEFIKEAREMKELSKEYKVPFVINDNIEVALAVDADGVHIGQDDMSVEEYRKAAVDAVRKLSVDVGIPTKLEALKEEDLQFLAESAHADACAPGNPKDASVEDLKDLFRKLM